MNLPQRSTSSIRRLKHWTPITNTGVTLVNGVSRSTAETMYLANTLTTMLMESATVHKFGPPTSQRISAIPYPKLIWFTLSEPQDTPS